MSTHSFLSYPPTNTGLENLLNILVCDSFAPKILVGTTVPKTFHSLKGSLCLYDHLVQPTSLDFSL